jgi:hypothetical protein
MNSTYEGSEMGYDGEDSMGGGVENHSRMQMKHSKGEEMFTSRSLGREPTGMVNMLNGRNMQNANMT